VYYVRRGHCYTLKNSIHHGESNRLFVFIQVSAKEKKREGAPKTPEGKTATAAGKQSRGSTKSQGSRSSSKGPKGSRKPQTGAGKRGRDRVVKPKPKLSAASAQQFLEERAQLEEWKLQFPPKSVTCITCSAVEVIPTMRQVSDAERYLAKGGGRMPEYDLCGTCVRAKAVANRLRKAREEALQADLDIVHAAPSVRDAALAEKRRIRDDAKDVLERRKEESKDEEEMREYRRLVVAKAGIDAPEARDPEVAELPGRAAEELVAEDLVEEAEFVADALAPVVDALPEVFDMGLVADVERVELEEVKRDPPPVVMDWDRAMRLIAPNPLPPVEGVDIKGLERAQPLDFPPPQAVARVFPPPLRPEHLGAPPREPDPGKGFDAAEVPERQSRFQFEMSLREKYVMLDYTPYDMGSDYRPIEQNTTLMNLKAKLINGTSAWKTYSDECVLHGIRRGRIAVPKSMLASIKLKYAQFEFKKAANEADHEQNFKQLRHNAGQWFQRAYFDYTGVQTGGNEVGVKVMPHFFHQNDPQPHGLNEWALFAMAAVVEHMIVTHTKAVSAIAHTQRVQLREIERSIQYQNPYTPGNLLCECVVATAAVVGCCVGAALSPVVVGVGHVVDQFVEPSEDNVVETVFNPMRKMFNSRLLETRTSRKRQRLDNYVMSRPPTEPVPAFVDFEPDKKGGGTRCCETLARVLKLEPENPPLKRHRITRERVPISAPTTAYEMPFPPPQVH